MIDWRSAAIREAESLILSGKSRVHVDQSYMRKNSIIWVQQFGVIVILSLVFRSLFVKNIIYYDEKAITPLSERMLRIINRFGFGKKFQKALLSFNRNDIKESTLFYQIRSDIDQCCEDICTQYKLTGDIRLKNMVKCYLCDILGPPITFVNMVRNKINAKEAKHEIYICKNSLNVFIKRFYKKQGYVIKESGIISEKVGIIIRIFAHYARMIYGKFFYKCIFTNIKEIKPAVWVEYDNERHINYCFWQDYVNRDRTEVVNFLFRNDYPENVIQTMEQQGIKWADCHILPVLRMSGISLKQIAGTVKRLLKNVNDYPLVLAYLFFLRHYYYMIYRKVLEKYQVRVLIQHHDTSWLQDMWARAVEDAGGILLNFHWSNYPTIMTPSHLFSFHIFFLWGEALYSFIEEGGHTCKYILPSGLWIGADGNSSSIQHFPGEVNFVIALFDSSAAYNIHQTEETLSCFYLRILELLESRPSWGLIVKSKNWDINGFRNLPAGELIIQKLKRLMGSGKAQVLPPSSSPITAASSAHLSVCYGLNSAGIVVAAHGQKAIHWDCSGWYNHPFYKDEEQKFIFRSLDEIEEAIIKASEGSSDIGDFSRWRKQYNYFEDFNASRRVGAFIEDFLDEINSHHNVEVALKSAVDKYRKENHVGEPFC